MNCYPTNDTLDRVSNNIENSNGLQNTNSSQLSGHADESKCAVLHRISSNQYDITGITEELHKYGLPLQITEESYKYDLPLQITEEPYEYDLPLQINEEPHEYGLSLDITEESYKYDLPLQITKELSEYDLSLQITGESYEYDPLYEYNPTFKYEIPSTSGLGVNGNYKQMVVNEYDVKRIISEHKYALPFKYETPSTSGLNVSNHPTQAETQRMLGNSSSIDEPNYGQASLKFTLLNKSTDPLQSTSLPAYESYVIDNPSCELVRCKFGTSLLSWDGGIYSLSVRKIGLGLEAYQIGSVALQNKKKTSSINLLYSDESAGKNFSAVLHYLEEIFISLVMEEVEDIEEKHPVQVRSGMSIENIRHEAINNGVFFKKLSKKCVNIIHSKIKSDIYKCIPSKIFIDTNLASSHRFSFDERFHSSRFDTTMINSISNLRERIVRFTAQATPEFILSSFFGKFCGLYLQRQLLQEVKNIGNKISDSIQDFPISEIIFNTEVSLAISSYTNTGNIPQHSLSGFYDYVHRVVYKFEGNIHSKIREFRFFYNELTGTVSEIPEGDVSVYAHRLLEYFKYACMLSYRKKLSNVPNNRKRPLVDPCKRKNLEASTVEKYDVSSISNIGINSTHISEGIYFSAVKNSSFRHNYFEEVFLLEMKMYIRSLNIENPEFADLYDNIMGSIAKIIAIKLEKLELNLASHILIPGNNLSAIRGIVLSNGYHLDQFYKICANEIILIEQCDRKLSYGLSVEKCFFIKKSSYASKSSVLLIMPRRVKSKYCFSPEISLDILKSAILKLPGMVASTISSADDGFFARAVFKDFDGIVVAKKSLQEISELGRAILQSSHENKYLIGSSNCVVDEVMSIFPLYGIIGHDNLVSRARNIILYKNSKPIQIIDGILLSFEDEMRRLSKKSIILLGDTISLPTEDISNKLFDKFKTEVRNICINSFLEICVMRVENVLSNDHQPK
ncbi:hypothetical protein [Candidatus Ichthyocystis sparus]|nr:hypothetical protein [Candidatus Ichthyocystis sparus]